MPDLPAPCFYVTMIDGKLTAYLLGPYETKDAAEAHVERARSHVIERTPMSWFNGFGVTRVQPVPGSPAPPGRLNARIGLLVALDG